MFITFEGGEGAGKSTQARRLAVRLQTEGWSVTLTREPGGSPGAEDIRALLVTGDPSRWTAQAEALLSYAARESHLTDTIRPALQRGDIVICDRFMDSTRAYQGYAGGCSLRFIAELEQQVVGATRPELTIIFDLDAEIGLARAKASENRFERKGLDFHRKLRHGFLAIAKDDPRRCKIIDATRSVDATAEEIWSLVQERLA